MCPDVPDKERDTQHSGRQPPPLELLHEQHHRSGDGRDEEQAEDIQVALLLLLLRNCLNQKRNGNYQNERNQEHSRPGNVGSHDSRSQRSNQQRSLESRGGKAEVGFLIFWA